MSGKYLGVAALAVLLGSHAVGAQHASGSINSRIRKAEVTVLRLERELRSVRNQADLEREQNAKRIKALEDSLNASDAKKQELLTQLDDRIDTAQAQSENRFAETDSSVSRSYVTMAIGGVVLAGLTGLLFLFLARRIGSQKVETEETIRRTRRALEEEYIKLDEKLIEGFDRKLSTNASDGIPISTNDEPDHSLALKVADEIVRIEKNLAFMDPDIRGRKQLAASVERIRDNFAAQGYEIVAMLGKPYDEGMKVIANFKDSTSLSPGERVITKVLKPHVNFNGVMIQAAQIEVSQG